MFAGWIVAAGLLSLAQAQSYHPPTNATFGALYTPDLTHPVTTGQTFQVTWDPTGHTTDGSTISLVLCHGPSTNCVNSPTALVSGIPASQASYAWNVPCSLAAGTQQTATGYGMLIIVDQTGQFQCSSCGSAPVNSTSSASSMNTMTSSGGYTSSTSATGTWNSWSSSSYVTTTWSAVYSSATPMVLTTPAATSTLAPSSSPSQFHGAANKIGASAAGLAMAAGAAFLAL